MRSWQVEARESEEISRLPRFDARIACHERYPTVADLFGVEKIPFEVFDFVVLGDTITGVVTAGGLEVEQSARDQRIDRTGNGGEEFQYPVRIGNFQLLDEATITANLKVASILRIRAEPDVAASIAQPGPSALERLIRDSSGSDA